MTRPAYDGLLGPGQERWHTCRSDAAALEQIGATAIRWLRNNDGGVDRRLTIDGVKAMLGASAALAGAILAAAPAIAEIPQDAGAMCESVELNKTAIAGDGTGMTLRCLADEKGGFTWMADTGAVGTVAQLQAEGYTATITRVGSGSLDQCEVIEVLNPKTYNRTTNSHSQGGGANTIVIHKTIEVSLDCSQR